MAQDPRQFKKVLRARWRREAPKDPAFWREVGDKIASRLSPYLRGRLGIFAPLVAEPDLRSLWSADRVFFPRIAGTSMAFYRVDRLDELVPGHFGVLEPPEVPERMAVWGKDDMLAIPGVYFDGQGGRLGKGMGFYDRFLAAFPGRKVGVCWSGQVVEDSLAREPFDVRMDALCTELNWVALDRK